jgi:hypothetical protein
LEKLSIFYTIDLKIIGHNQFTADSFYKPEIMKVEFFENIVVKETFVVIATQLKELHMIHLPKLKHKDPQEILSFQNPFQVDFM